MVKEFEKGILLSWKISFRTATFKLLLKYAIQIIVGSIGNEMEKGSRHKRRFLHL